MATSCSVGVQQVAPACIGDKQQILHARQWIQAKLQSVAEPQSRLLEGCRILYLQHALVTYAVSTFHLSPCVRQSGGPESYQVACAQLPCWVLLCPACNQQLYQSSAGPQRLSAPTRLILWYRAVQLPAGRQHGLLKPWQRARACTASLTHVTCCNLIIDHL